LIFKQMFDIFWGMDLGSGAVVIVESEESGEELAPCAG